MPDSEDKRCAAEAHWTLLKRYCSPREVIAAGVWRALLGLLAGLEPGLGAGAGRSEDSTLGDGVGAILGACVGPGLSACFGAGAGAAGTKTGEADGSTIGMAPCMSVENKSLHVSTQS